MFNDLKNDYLTQFCTLVFCFVLPYLFSQWIRDSFSLTVVSLYVIIFKDILYTDSPVIFLLEHTVRASNVFSVFHIPLPHAALHILSVISQRSVRYKKILHAYGHRFFACFAVLGLLPFPFH